MEENNNAGFKTSNPLILFLIGVTGGMIAAIFPRLMTLLSVPDQNVDIILFSQGYLLASMLFAFIMGISMLWLFLGSADSTKNLFMAALALPAVLSGGLNMTNTVTAGQADINELTMKNEVLQNKLLDLANIPVFDSIDFEPDDVVESPIDETVNSTSSLINFLTVSNAYAEANGKNPGEDSATFNTGVQFNVESNKKNYILLIDKSTDKQRLLEKLKTYSDEYGIANLKIKKSKNIFYLIKKDKKTKSEALLEAIELQKKHSEIKPRLMKTK